MTTEKEMKQIQNEFKERMDEGELLNCMRRGFLSSFLSDLYRIGISGNTLSARAYRLNESRSGRYD